MSKFSKFRNDLSKEVVNETKGENNKSQSKVFVPGVYDVKIVNVEDSGPNKFDEAWLTYAVTFEGVGGKTIREWINVPTEDTESESLDGRYPNSTFKRLIRFLDALGLDTTQPTSDLLTAAFENTASLVGANVKIDVGYRGPHAEYDKSAGGYKLLNKDNQPMSEDVFETRDALVAYTIQAGVKGFKAFPNILSYSASDIKNEIGAKKAAPKKLAGKSSIPSGL